MDLHKLINDLYTRKHQLDRTIAALEDLEAAREPVQPPVATGQGPRGPQRRKSRRAQERQQDSDT
jgi:hypothetical protein